MNIRFYELDVKGKKFHKKINYKKQNRHKKLFIKYLT